MGKAKQRRAMAATPTAVWLAVSVLVGGCAISAVDAVTGNRPVGLILVRLL